MAAVINGADIGTGSARAVYCFIIDRYRCPGTGSVLVPVRRHYS